MGMFLSVFQWLPSYVLYYLLVVDFYFLCPYRLTWTYHNSMIYELSRQFPAALHHQTWILQWKR